jgi:hypothetical protein
MMGPPIDPVPDEDEDSGDDEPWGVKLPADKKL